MGLDGLRQARWLNRARITGYLRLAALVYLGSLGWLLLSSVHGVDRSGQLVGTDFLSFWAQSVLELRGGPAYDAAAHLLIERQFFPALQGDVAFFYPPPFLLVCWPLARFGYFPALALWLAITGTGFVCALRAWLGSAGLRAVPLWLLFGFPPVFLTITHGQTSFLLAALLGGGLWLVARGRGALGGALLALAVFKPQFGVLVPVVLVCARQWRALGAAGGCALLLAGLTTLAFGPGIWREWLGVSAPAQAAMAGGAIGFAKMTSIFAGARLAGASVLAAYALQGAVALVVAALLARLAWREGLSQRCVAATLAAAPLATPFVLDYDLLLLAFPLVWLAGQPPRAWSRPVAAAAFVLPALARQIGTASGIALGPPVILALFWAIVRDGEAG